MKISPVVAELFHVDERTGGRTDKQDEVNNRLSQFCERAYKFLVLAVKYVISFTYFKQNWNKRIPYFSVHSNMSGGNRTVPQDRRDEYMSFFFPVALRAYIRHGTMFTEQPVHRLH
jgi:hypothetical protein